MEQGPKQQEYWQLVAQEEESLFPEESKLSRQQGGFGNFGLENDNNIYYLPSHYFLREFISEKDVADLATQSKKMLSVGSGPAYLERFLVHRGVRPENIQLADKRTDTHPPGFRFTKLDMFSEWDQIENGPFDLIIFPESVMIMIPFDQKRADDWSVEERDLYLADKIHQLAAKALIHLAPDGEIRMIGPSIPASDVMDEELEKLLARDGQEISMQRHGKTLIVKKGISNLRP
jgi:hypothetical protein